MDFINQTPFQPLPFESIDLEGEPFFTIAVRGTFKIVNGEALRPLPEQEEVIYADTYYGDTSKSSLHWPNDLAPFKPNADIHVIGTARAAKQEPATSWKVKVNVGKLSSAIEVHGPRKWFYDNAGGWMLTEPLPCTEVDLRYELASGGTWGDAEEGDFSETNPLGRGCCNLKKLDKADTFLAPQILAVGQSIPPLGDTYPAAGFAPLPPSWIQRRQHAGTYDQEWEDNRHPLSPEDFKFDFYNAAHPDLIYPGYLKGDEKVELEGLLASGTLSFSLPDYDLGAVLTDKGDYSFGGIGELDTLQIDVEGMKVYLVWRVTVPLLGDPIEKVVLKMRENAKLRTQIQKGDE